MLRVASDFLEHEVNGLLGVSPTGLLTSEGQAILALFTDEMTALKSSEVAEGIGLGKTRTNELLRGLVNDGILVAEGSARNRVYKRVDN